MEVSARYALVYFPILAKERKVSKGTSVLLALYFVALGVYAVLVGVLANYHYERGNRCVQTSMGDRN